MQDVTRAMVRSLVSRAAVAEAMSAVTVLSGLTLAITVGFKDDPASRRDEGLGKCALTGEPTPATPPDRLVCLVRAALRPPRERTKT